MEPVTIERYEFVLYTALWWNNNIHSVTLRNCSNGIRMRSVKLMTLS